MWRAAWCHRWSTRSCTYGIKAIDLNHGFCRWQAVTIRVLSRACVCLPNNWSTHTFFLMQSRDVHRQMITVAVGQPIALSSGCCPRLCPWQLDSRLTAEHGSATVLRDFVKCVAHQNARAAPAEVSHPLLTMALLAPPVTCELGNERRGGAVIYITNVRVRRTWTPPRLLAPHQPLWSDGDA